MRVCGDLFTSSYANYRLRDSLSAVTRQHTPGSPGGGHAPSLPELPYNNLRTHMLSLRLGISVLAVKALRAIEEKPYRLWIRPQTREPVTSSITEMSAAKIHG